MTSRVRAAAGCVIAGLALAGCYESHPGVNVAQRDGGPRDGAIGLDAAAGGGAAGDAAVVDGAAVDGAALGTDGATIDASVLACDAPVVPYEGAGCTDATRTCIAACADAACVNGCVAGDPECVRCIDQTLVACANERGCEPQWNDFACCAQGRPDCAARSGADLLACADACDEIDAFDACTTSIDTTSCVSDIGARCGL